MPHLPALIQDLGLILVTAASVTLLFKWLNQPLVLGYLIAGLLIGPNLPYTPTVVDIESIKVWAEIGVIFLLFGLGFKFSFKKLARVGGSASITAGLEVICMLAIGYITGRALDWSPMDSLFLGCMLSISSTTIIVRVFDELGLKGQNFISLVFGVLIVEDLIAILLLVLLSTITLNQSFSGTDLFYAATRLCFFLALWFLIGIYLVPIFLKKIRNLMNDETMLVIAIGLCLMMVLIAVRLGFSPALGAFVIGSILAETKEGERIEKLIYPVKNLFAAVFFVSVGMLIDPKIIAEHAGAIFLLTIVTILGKFLSSTLGALLSGKSLKNSIKVGLSLAQIGEFSFIIATLGLTLNATSDFLYPIAVSVSAITTFTTPYQIKYADKVYYWVEKYIPLKTMDYLKKYESAVLYSSGQGAVQSMLQKHGLKILLNAVLVVAIGLTGGQYVLPFMIKQVGEGWIASSFSAILTLIFATPFLWAIIMATPDHLETLSQETAVLLKRLRLGISTVKFIIGVTLILFLTSRFAPIHTPLGLILMSGAMVLIIFSKYIGQFYQFIEKRFVSNLHEREKADNKKKRPVPVLSPWEATLSSFVVSPDSNFVGKTIQQSQLRDTYGLTVGMIRRGGKTMLAPGPLEQLMPFDQIFLIGTDQQFSAVQNIIEAHIEIEDQLEVENFGLDSLLLHSRSSLIGKSILDSGIRQDIKGLIVGVERKLERILNPGPSFVLQEGDLIWLVGDLTKIAHIKNAG